MEIRNCRGASSAFFCALLSAASGVYNAGRLLAPNQAMTRTVTCCLSLAFAALLAACLCGCGSSSARTDTLIYAQSEDPKTLDPINTDIAEAVHVITNVFDTLVTYHDETSEIVPSLAEKWGTSDDGLAWTFQLRKGVKFHDGTPLNAAAVKTSFDRLLADKHPLVYDTARPYQSAYSMIREIATPDDRTVVFHLKHPSAVFLSNLAMFCGSVVSPAALEKLGADFADQPVGTGPFKVVKWTRDQQLVLERFDDHWRGPARLKNIIFVPVRESATRLQRLQRGEIDLADNLSPSELSVLTKNSAMKVQEVDGMNVCYLSLQTEKAPLDNVKVRRAIWLAIDKRELIQVGYTGHAQPAKSMVPPTMWGHHDRLEDRPFDLAEAERLMKEASQEAGFSLPLALALSIPNQARAYMPRPIEMADYLKDALAKIGIEVSVVGRDVNQHFQALMAGEHELGLAGWNSDNADPDNFLYSLLDPDNISDAGNNLSRWRDDRFHELLLAGQKEMDREKRLALYLEAQEIVLAEAPVVPLAHTKIRTAHQSRLNGFHLHTTGLVRLRQAHFEESL
jgi:peptide/nickel transport system substrate-binding protein